MIEVDLYSNGQIDNISLFLLKSSFTNEKFNIIEVCFIEKEITSNCCLTI
jgi:hypothetical protein